MSKDGSRPEGKKPGPLTPEEALQHILRRETQFSAPFVEALRAGLTPSIPAAADAPAPAGAIAGGNEERKRGRSRSRQGRSMLHGADRTVRVYKLTEAELSLLGELSKDEKSARTWAAFCAGLVVNVILGLLFASGLSTTNKAVGVAIGVCAFVGAVKFGLDANKKRKDGKAELNRIKEDHDFADA